MSMQKRMKSGPEDGVAKLSLL